jgi:hypothetical protein
LAGGAFAGGAFAFGGSGLRAGGCGLATADLEGVGALGRAVGEFERLAPPGDDGLVGLVSVSAFSVVGSAGTVISVPQFEHRHTPPAKPASSSRNVLQDGHSSSMVVSLGFDFFEVLEVGFIFCVHWRPYVLRATHCRIAGAADGDSLAHHDSNTK